MRMKAYRKIGVLLLILLVVSQFIQPKRNTSATIITENDISKVYAMPNDLHQVLINKCYDCHSNNTRYPWYFYIQPIGWWLAAHVHEGKEELNFSEFRSYDQKKTDHKLEELEEVTEDRSMPLKAYTLFHEEAKITEEDEQMIKGWLSSLKPAAN